MIDIPVGRTPSGKRSFTVGWKVEFLQLWDGATERGANTRLLREYALDPSVVREWQRARDDGEFEAAMVKAADSVTPVGEKITSRERAELARLRDENKRLAAKVAQAEAAQDILGKAFELLEGITKNSTEEHNQIPVALMSAEQYRQWLTRKGLS